MPWSPDNPVIGEFEDLPVQMLSRSSYFVPADSVPSAQEVLPNTEPLSVCSVSPVLPPSDAEPAPIPAPLPDCHPQVNADHTVDESPLSAPRRRTVRRSPSTRVAVSKPPVSLPADPVRAYLRTFFAGYPDADDQRGTPVSSPSNPPALGIPLPSVSIHAVDMHAVRMNAASAHSNRLATSAFARPERASISTTRTSRSTRDHPPTSHSGSSSGSFTRPATQLAEAGFRAPELLMDAISIIRSPDSGAQDKLFDAIIVDEAQDFEETWWIPLSGLLHDPAGASIRTCCIA